jgi:hypothetical protein
MATNFLWAGGTSNNGLVASSAVTLMTTELESLTNGSVTVSSVNGSSGLFKNSSFNQAMWAELYLSLGNPGISSALSAGGNLAGWFLTSLDGGSTYESGSVAPPRPPDFLIPLPATTIAGGASPFKAAGLVLIPALEFYTLVQNNSGQTFGAGSTTPPWLKAAPIAMQY